MVHPAGDSAGTISKYQPTEHGMLTTSFLDEFLDALSENEDEVPNAVDGSLNHSKHDVILAQGYQAKIAFPGHFAQWYPTVAQLPEAEFIDNIARLIHRSNPEGLNQLKRTVEYFYYQNRLQEVERICRAWMHIVKPAKETEGQNRWTSIRDVVEIGLRIAYQLGNLEMAQFYYSHLVRRPSRSSGASYEGSLRLSTDHVFFA
jgi:hypothetical protein